MVVLKSLQIARMTPHFQGLDGSNATSVFLLVSLGGPVQVDERDEPRLVADTSVSEQDERIHAG